jgi:hypothetical protein
MFRGIRRREPPWARVLHALITPVSKGTLVARRPKQKMLTQLPQRFDPNFADRLSRRYSLAGVVLARRVELETHLGGAEALSYVERGLVKRTLWLELLIERYEQQVANGEAVDIGAITQLNNSLKGLYKDLGLKRRTKPAKPLAEIVAEAPAA